jgi:ketosteroid isomerase-like protein
MKKLLAISVLLLAACGSSQMSSDFQSGDAENHIKQADVAFATAMRTNDMDALVNNYSSDAILMPPNLPGASGPSAIRATWTGFLGQFSSNDLTLTPDDVQQSGDLAVESGHYMVHVVPKGTTMQVTDSGKYIVVWKKMDGRWKIYRDIFNSDLPVPTGH